MTSTEVFELPAKILAILMAVAMLFTNIMDYGTAHASANVQLVREDKLVLTDAMYSGQGITTDGKYYYTSGAMTAANMNGLAKWQAKTDAETGKQTFELVLSHLQAIPDDLNEKYQSNHIGGISYYNGLIYAAVENETDDHPFIITYNARTLKEVDRYELPIGYLPNGVPWCAVDAENGYLYCSPFRDVTKIPAFKLDTMEFSHYINLSESITRIQGAEVYDGLLYFSYDVADSNVDQIKSIDVLTGEVKLICERTIPSLAGNEAEGITVFPMEDGSFFHVLDYDKTLGVYVRHYSYSGYEA